MRVRASALAVVGPPRLVGQRGAAFYLGISVRSVQNLVAAGRLVPVKLLSHTRLFDIQDLDHLVDQVKANQ